MGPINNNIEETHVSLPVAKLLKEAGFDCPTGEWRQHGDGISGDVTGKWGRYNSKGDVYTSLPTQQLAIDWIRVNFGIVIYTYSVAPYIAEDEDYPKIVWVSKVQKYFEFDRFIDTDNGLARNHFNTPEEAKEAALEYCLTSLILKK